VSFATGSSDGFVEIWNWVRSKLRSDLSYQAKDELMLHTSEVLCLSWSKDSELLASADAKGGVKVWQISTGKCVRRFKTAHDKGVTSIHWSSDLSKLITSSLDGTVRLHGLRSGKTLKFFRGHSSYVHRCLYAHNEIVSCSTDGSVKLWDKKSGDLSQSYTVSDFDPAASKQQKGANSAAAVVDLINGRDKEGVVVVDKSNSIYRLSMNGTLLRRYVADEDDVEFCAICVSSLGKYLYGGTTSGKLFIFDYESGNIEEKMQVAETEIISLKIHPHLNVLSILSFNDNKALLYRPTDQNQ
jgi:WD40 repeat-containing protein SMU1